MLAEPEAVAQHYRSVDSAPARYAVDRPHAGNGFLAIFLALSLVELLAVTAAVNTGYLEGGRDLVVAAAANQRAAVPVRVFVLGFFIAIGLSIASNGWRRAALVAELVLGFAAVSALVDVAAAASYALGLPTKVVGQQIVSCLLSLAVFPFVIMRNAHLPQPIALAMSGRIRVRAWLTLVIPLVIAFVIAAAVEQRRAELIAWMRDVALLGGVGPGLFLVQQVFALITGGIGLMMVGRSRRATFAPRLGVVVPAHNEAHDIGDTIAALDQAAAAYGGQVRLYVVDNLSTDQTIEVATAAIAACRALTGEVLRCDEPGKALALNYGLARIREPFVVRIDADTLVGENCLDLALRHFADAAVGAVSGLPLPVGHRGFIERSRLVEVLVRHGFFQISLMGYDGILGEPGMFVVYRRSALDAVGPIVQGMNGEDTDICIRMGVVGYRCVTDPKAVYRSETPRSWAHLREQRVRWFRSIYHLAAHNRRAIFSRYSMGGAIVLPFQLVSAARRAMLLPVLIFALLVFTLFDSTFPGLHWQPVLATVLGMPLLVAMMVCLLNRRPRALLYVPGYLVFRLVRSYFTIAAVLSLVFPPLHPSELVRSRARRLRGGKSGSP